MATYIGRKHYTVEFKQKVIKDLFKYKSKTDISKKYNISMSSVTKWLNQFMNGDIHGSKSGYHNKYNNMTFDWKNPIFEWLSDSQMKQYEYIVKDVSTNWSRIKKYQYINKVKQNIRYLCKLLNVSTSAYYDWVKKGCKQINAYKENVNSIVYDAFNLLDLKLGYRRLKHVINSQYGEDISYYHVRKYMRLNNLYGQSNKKKRKHTPNTKKLKETKNLVGYNFKASKRNKLWFIDYTYVRVNTKWQYVGFIKDAYDNRIVNYHIIDRRSPKKVKSLLRKALLENKYNDLTIHMDQGTEFNNGSVHSYLENKNIIQSFSYKGKPTSNASIETLISSFKRDYNPKNIKLVKRKDLQKLVDQYVDLYNFILPQESLNWKSPLNYK